MSFRKAQRKRSKLRLAICGPSGSGKTYSALLIAKGLAPDGRIALIDTERGSGELYSGLTSYDVAALTPPFTPQRYIALIRDAEKAGYDVLIIDSLSHAWTGEGGVLEMHDKAAAASRSGNSYTAWREVTPQHNALVDAIIGAALHVVVTMRTKTAYDLVDDGNGKKKPVKLGLAPVQREGMEYEFTAVIDLSVDGHVATASKDRTSLFDGQHWVPTAATGDTLREWLESGKEAPLEVPKPETRPSTLTDRLAERVSAATAPGPGYGATWSEELAACGTDAEVRAWYKNKAANWGTYTGVQQQALLSLSKGRAAEIKAEGATPPDVVAEVAA